jgi:hypothetical protein
MILAWLRAEGSPVSFEEPSGREGKEKARTLWASRRERARASSEGRGLGLKDEPSRADMRRSAKEKMDEECGQPAMWSMLWM